MIGHSLASLGQGLISMLLVLQRALLLTKHCRRVKFGVLYTFFIKLDNFSKYCSTQRLFSLCEFNSWEIFISNQFQAISNHHDLLLLLVEALDRCIYRLYSTAYMFNFS